MMKINFILLFLVLSVGTCGQSNTAVISGNIGKCGVWDYPYTLYNTAAASQTVNNGVQVTVDQDRNIGAINLTHMTAGGTLSYATETGYTNDPACSNTQMTYTIGTAYVTYEN